MRITKEMTKDIHYGQMYPRHFIKMNISHEKLLKCVGSNHFSGLYGNHISQVEYICRKAGIPLIRIDSNRSLDEFQEILVDL